MNLYLLQFKDGKRFKIGVSRDVPRRIHSPGGGQHFNMDNSLVISGNATAIKHLERQLHDDYSPHRLYCDELKSGNKEIFDVECWDDVVDDIDRKIEKFPHLRLHKAATNDFSQDTGKTYREKRVKLSDSDHSSLKNFLFKVISTDHAPVIFANKTTGEIIGITFDWAPTVPRPSCSISDGLDGEYDLFSNSRRFVDGRVLLAVGGSVKFNKTKKALSVLKKYFREYETKKVSVADLDYLTHLCEMEYGIMVESPSIRVKFPPTESSIDRS